MPDFPESNFLQSPLWAETNRLLGHKVLEGTVDDQARFLAIVKDAKRGRYLEIPGGPLLDWKDKSLAKRVFSKIADLGRSEKCVFVRFRPQLENTEENQKILQTIRTSSNLDLRPAPMHLHAQNTVILDLTKSEDDLLMELRRQTRYEVRRAEKLEIKASHDESESVFRTFHQIQLETAKRQDFVPPSLKELLAEREAFKDNARLYISKTKDGEPLAYGLILSFATEAAYFEAASTDLNRKLPGTYALLWTAIKDLKAAGFERFNLWGIAPPGVENHRYSGVTTFKTGFGGRVVEFIPAQDIVLNKLRYKLDELVETARKKKRNL